MNDLIRREEVMSVIDRYKMSNFLRTHLKAGLLELPSAEPKVGKWINHKEIIYTDPEIWGYSQECSLCGFTLGAKEYNYCPNCGAKMEG